MASQITSLLIVYLTVCSGADKRKHQDSASLAFVRGIHQWPVNSPQKEPVTRTMFPIDDVIMYKPGGRLNIKMPSYQYRDLHVRDYKNPLHLDVVDRYLRRMGDKTIPDEALPSLESFYPPWVAGIDLPQSRCCGFFVSFTNKHK